MICFMIVWLIKYQTQLKAFVFQHFCMNQLEHIDRLQEAPNIGQLPQQPKETADKFH